MVSETVAVCEPLAIALEPKHIRSHCNYCLLQFDPAKLKTCANCQFVSYCSDVCRKTEENEHTLECNILKGKFTEWVSTAEVWENAKVGRSGPECVILMLRIYLKLRAGLLDNLKGKFSTKTFENLMTHKEELKKHEATMSDFQRYHSFISKVLMPGAEFSTPDFSEVLFSIYCKICINSHSIFTYTSNAICKIVGITLGLDMSAYDHSCRPNVQIYWNGRKAYFVPLDQKTDAHDVKHSYISYIYLIETKVARRQRLLKDYYFTCQCQRCLDPRDNFLSSFFCKSCLEPVPLKESTDIVSSPPEGIKCPKCDSIQPIDYVAVAVRIMAEVEQALLRKAPLERILDLRLECVTFLPKGNVYFGKLAQQLAEDESLNDTEGAKNWLYFYNVMTFCMPRHYSESITVLTRACHALLVDGDFLKARGLFQELEEAAEHYFVNGNCTFQRLLEYLYDCIRHERRPMVSFWHEDSSS